MPELLTFIETGIFTKRIAARGLEGSLRGLQLELLDNPEAGDVEPGAAGLRKMRIGDPTRGKGKRGGARAHYLWLPQSWSNLSDVHLRQERSKHVDGRPEEAAARDRRANQSDGSPKE